MPEINTLAIIVAGLIPMILGAIWYGPLFGKQWYDSMGKTEEEMQPNNMAVIYGLALLVAMWLSFNLKMIIEIMHKESDIKGQIFYNSTHTFSHGAFHGLMIYFCLVFPVLLSYSLFHKKSPKNIILNGLFWAVGFAVMGGILDAWV